jgi:hypothetical protein
MAADLQEIEPGDVVLAHMVGPAEKYLGILVALEPVGITVRAVSLSSFDSWMRELAGEGSVTLGPATMFFPLHRVERLFLDEEVGAVESYGRRFHRIVGRKLEEHLA